MTQPQHSDGWFEGLLNDLLRSLGMLLTGVLTTLWRYRTEVLLALPFVALGFFLRDAPLAIQLCAASTVALISWQVRRPLLGLLHRTRVRRQWVYALNVVGLKPPHIRRVFRTDAGDILIVRITSRCPVKDLQKHAERIASELPGGPEVRVVQDPDARKASVLLMRRDPFQGAEPMPWPNRILAQASIWQPIPFGVSEEGKRINLSLVGTHLLIGGESGGGKSVALSMVAATAALDPNARLWCFDAKVVELNAWAPVAEQTIGPNGKDAIKALEALNDVLDERYLDLKRNGRRKITQADGLPIHVVLIDEAADFFDLDDRKESQEFARLLGRLVRLGRAAGIIVVAATQKSGGDTIPTKVRDIFPRRLAFRCSSPEMSDTILGAGTRSRGYDASTIPVGTKTGEDERTGYEGVGYLWSEGSFPLKMKTYYLSDDDIETIATRAATSSLDAEMALVGGTPEQDDGYADLEAMWNLPAAGTVPDETMDVSRETFDGSPTRNHGMRARDHDGDIERVRVLLAAHPEGLRREEIYTGDGTHPGVPFATILPLIQSGEVIKEGRGVKGSPFRYRLAGPTGRDAETDGGP